MTFENIKSLLPETTCLVYVDYRDSLDEHPETIEQIVSSNNYDKLNEQISDWYCDAELHSLDEYLKQLRTDIENKIGLSEEDAENLIQANREAITDTIYERCKDDTVKDLLRNTGEEIFFYDTGLEVAADSWAWSKKDVRHWLYEVKKALQIKKNKDFDEAISMMLSQATYGGNLVIYFTASPDDLINSNSDEQDWKTIEFSSPNVAIIDTCGGSGDDCFLQGHRLTLPFVRDRLTLDRSIKYNYSFAVCGMSKDWCKDTGFTFGELGQPATSDDPNTIKEEILRNIKFSEIYRQGKCSFGDMDINRHRGITYINNFPCGNKCPHCGTFWID